MPRTRPLHVDTEDLAHRLEESDHVSVSSLASAIDERPRRVQLLFKHGKGDPRLVEAVYRALGVSISDMPSLLRRTGSESAMRIHHAPSQLDHRLAEGLMMAGHLSVVRRRVAELRTAGDDPVIVDLLEAELAKWVGDFDAASATFERLRGARNHDVRYHALAGLLRIARERGDVPAVKKVRAELTSASKSAAPRSYVMSTVRAARGWLALLSKKYPTATDHLQRALTLASRSESRIEPLKRMIDRASLLRKQYLQFGIPEDGRAAGAAYLCTFAEASSANCFTYMASALNGLARIAEHEATLAEEENDHKAKETKLADAAKLLEMAVGLAELSEHAGIIAITVGCLGTVRRRQGDFETAIRLSSRSLSLEEKMRRLAYAEVDRRNVELAEAKSTKPVPRT